MPREKLGEILIRAGLLDEIGLQRALNEQQRWGGQLGRYLVELGLITEETLVRALSTQYKMPAVALDPPRMNISVGRLVPKDICERNGLVCFRADVKAKFLDVALSDPSNADAIDEIRIATKFNVRPYIAAPTVIDKAISYIFYGDMALGGDLDLGPDSALRLDSRASELLRGAAQQQPVAAMPPQPPVAPVQVPPAPAPTWSPGVTPALDVQVKASGLAPGPPPNDPLRTSTSLAAVKPQDPFHITMDVPAVDKQALAAPSLEERLAAVEGTLARNTAMIQALLESLLRRGLITHDDVLHVISGKHQ